MKIGLIVNKEIHQLKGCELEVIKYLINNYTQNISLVRIDIIDNQEVVNSLATIILQKQFSIEKKRFVKSDINLIREELTNYFKSTSVIQVDSYIRNGYYEFNKTGINKLKKEKLDLIISLGCNRLKGDVIRAFKHGVWLLNYYKKNSNVILPIGFWEIIMNKPVVKTSLIKLSENTNRDRVIDQAYFNYHKWSAVLTNNLVIESSASLLLKNLNNLEKIEDNITLLRDEAELIQVQKPLTLGHSLEYISNFYKFYFEGFIKKYSSIINKSPKLWTLFIGSGNFLDQDLSKLVPVIVPKGEFWADPFLIKYKEEYYAFFENYSFKHKKGKISCGRIKGNKIIDVVDVLDLDYHLSYPFIFKENGEIFMMPEASSNKRLEIYKCISFPDKWELFSTAFEGENIADAFFYDDANKQKWLFLNKPTLPNSCKTSNLFVYMVDSLKLNQIIPHKQNPVLIDSRVSRNGGSIFSFNNKIFRPSQRNTHGIYGNRLNINEIEKLTLNDYVEKPFKIVDTNFHRGLKAMHHLHQVDDLFIFDASFKNIY